MSSNFSWAFFSDTRYECMTVEISCHGQILCQISKDLGNDAMEIEFFHQSYTLSSDPRLKVPLREFEDVLAKVKSQLSEFEAPEDPVLP